MAVALTGIFNVIIALLLSPLLEGIVRKHIRARVHSRQGPPIFQPYYDLFKLLGKEELRMKKDTMAKFMSVLSLAAVLVASLTVPMGLSSPLGKSGDMISFIYLITLAAVAMMLGALTVQSPYTYLGATREMMMALVVEPVVFIALAVTGIKAHSLALPHMACWNMVNGPTVSMILAGLALFLALNAQLGKLPFDIAEADQEIMGGPFIEMSGPRFAMIKWAFYAKQIVFASVFCSIFIPWPDLSGVVNSPAVATALVIVIHTVKVLITLILVGVIDVVNPRLRIDQAIEYYLAIIFLVSIALAFALVGV